MIIISANDIKNGCILVKTNFFQSKSRISLLGVFIITLLLIAFSISIFIIVNDFDPDIKPEEMGRVEFIEDFEFFYNILSDNYPYFFVKERQFGYNWLDLKESYLKRINLCENTTEFLNVMLDAVQTLQNGHTFICSPSYVVELAQYFVGENIYPYNEIFSDEVVEATEYWNDIFNQLIEKRDRSIFTVNKIQYDLLMVYDKGEYIVHEVWDETDSKLIGSKVISVDNIPIHDWIKSSYHVTLPFIDFARDRSYVEYLRPLYLNFSSNFIFENTTGNQFNADVSFSADYSYTSIKWRGYYPDLPVISTRLYPEDKVGYLQIGLMANPSNYHSQMMSFYQSIADYNHLIIDIRGNAGGNDNFWLEEIVYPLLKEQIDLSVYYAFNDKATYSHKLRELDNITEIVSKADFDYLPPETLSNEVKIYNISYSIPVHPDPVAFNGSISVLIDKLIYSSSETFSAFCKITGFAKLYGTSTGGDGIGNKAYFTLPNSKLVICFSYILGLFPSGYANEEIHTPPDVYYESSAGNWTELIDFTIENITSELGVIKES